MTGIRWFGDLRLVDGDGAMGDAPMSLGVDSDGRIAWIGPADHAPVDENRSIADCDGLVVVPGLIDAHVHLFRVSDDDPRGTYLAASDEERMAVARANARLALAAGVTTARDLGGPASLMRQLADEVAVDVSAGPNLVWSGAPVTRIGGDDHYFGGEVADRQAAVRLVDEQCDLGAGLVAMVVSGGGLTPGTSPARVELDIEIMRAVCARAEQRGVAVVARCHATAGMVACRDVGVTTIEHASFLEADGVVRFDPSVAASLVSAGVSIGPTLFAAQQALARYQASGIANPDDVFAMTRLEARTDNFRSWLAAGVDFAAGSASGYLDVPASSLVNEAVAYVAAGMTPADALRAITAGNAAAIGRDDLGTLEVGRRADFVVVDRSPLDDITALRDPVAVVRGGHVVAGELGGVRGQDFSTQQVSPVREEH